MFRPPDGAQRHSVRDFWRSCLADDSRLLQTCKALRAGDRLGATLLLPGCTPCFESRDAPRCETDLCILTNVQTPSWKWFYPYHFAPFAGDFEDVKSMGDVYNFKAGEPFKPFEQLMGVFPSRRCVHLRLLRFRGTSPDL